MYVYVVVVGCEQLNEGKARWERFGIDLTNYLLYICPGLLPADFANPSQTEKSLKDNLSENPTGQNSMGFRTP